MSLLQNSRVDQELLDMKIPNSAHRDKLFLGSQLLQKVNETMNIPDPGRVARIQFLKKQVQKGTYKVDADKVAESMLKDLIKNLL
ncbi:MAG: flagellar biosynthesis anti-sigma factor FlgM [Deltaproteobacteria bacterium]|nr:flagellar biosynthesis anti-sigma factor FlgM [Deltaproteobacteria bacterium]